MKRLIVFGGLLAACDMHEPPPTVAPYSHPRDVERYGDREVEVARGRAADATDYDRSVHQPNAINPWSEAECPDGLLGGLISGAIEAATGSNPSPGCPNC